MCRELKLVKRSPWLPFCRFCCFTQRLRSFAWLNIKFVCAVSISDNETCPAGKRPSLLQQLCSRPGFPICWGQHKEAERSGTSSKEGRTVNHRCLFQNSALRPILTLRLEGCWSWSLLHHQYNTQWTCSIPEMPLVLLGSLCFVLWYKAWCLTHSLYLS